MLAILDGLEDQLTGNAVAADELHDDIDLGVAGHREDIVGHGNAGRLVLGLGCAGGNLRHLDATPGTTRDFLGVALEHIHGTATDGTQPTDAYFDRIHTRLPNCTA